MKISASNLRIYSSVNSSNNKTVVKTSPEVVDIERKSTNPFLYANADRLMKCHNTNFANISFGASAKIDQKMIDFLDKTKFELEVDKSGEKKMMTIKEAVTSSIERLVDKDGTYYHATGWKEMGEQIIKNGFNPEKISRTNLGPGFYFSGSEGGARFYSNCVLKADCNGVCALVKPQYYERIATPTVLDKMAEFRGMKAGNYSMRETQRKMNSQILNEYVRNYLVNDLGIDMAYGASNRAESCLVVYNPDVISNIDFV